MRSFCGMLPVLAVAFCLGTPRLGSQTGAQSAPANAAAVPARGAQVGFRYENRQLQPAVYTMVLDESGAGHFHSEPGDQPVEATPSYSPMPEPMDRAIQLSKPVAEQIFAVARGQKLFAFACDDHKGKIAFQGTKQLSYQGPDGSGACTYNWSRSVPIQKLTATFESIAYTLEEGRRLALEHKHDRLALDEELGLLLEAVKDGRALEVHTIQPELEEIAEDEAVLERARSRARKLLDAGGVTASLR